MRITKGDEIQSGSFHLVEFENLFERVDQDFGERDDFHRLQDLKQDHFIRGQSRLKMSKSDLPLYLDSIYLKTERIHLRASQNDK
jgi:hypothetical protein